MLAEPPRTAYDLNFDFAGVPVRVHPLFWLAGLVLGASSLEGQNGGMTMLIWMVVFFVSILIHEFGHSVLIRFFGQVPRVVLYMMGGLAITESGFGSYYGGSHRSPRQQILISLAGPGAGFLLAMFAVALLYSLGGDFICLLIDGSGNLHWDPEKFPFFIPVYPAGTSVALKILIWYVLYLNIFWGLVNLLPVYPLDGGQIARELFQMADPHTGTLRSLWLSVITGATVAIVGGIMIKSILLALLFGSLAVSAYMTIQQMTGRGGYGGRPW